MARFRLSVIKVDKLRSAHLKFLIIILSFTLICVPMVAALRNSLIRTPLRAVWDVAGYQTETLIWPASTAKKTVLVFIPGNPGLVEYYTSFLQGIYQAIASPSFEIIGGKNSTFTLL